jgi:hypothetical protein
MHYEDPNPYEQNRADKALQRRVLTSRWRAIQDEVDAASHISKQDLTEFPMAHSRTSYISVRETLVEVQNLFLPKHLNLNNTIFGGELLQWMVSLCPTLFSKW